MAKKEKAKKPIYKRWWFWVLAIIIIGAAVGGGEETTDTATDSGTNQTETTEQAQETSAPAEEPKEEEAVTAGVNEPLTVGDVTFTVTGTDTASNIGGEFGVSAQGQYYILDVAVKNEGNEAITTDSTFFKLKAGEATYEADGTADIYANEAGGGFFLQQVNPGIENSGKVVFDIPADVQPEQLQVQTGFWGTETGVINLQ